LVSFDTRFAWLRSRTVDWQDDLVQCLVFAGPFLLLAAAALRGGASCLAWGVLAAGLTLLTLCTGFIVFLHAREPSGPAQAGMGEGILTLWLLIGQYALAVVAALLGGGFDLLWWTTSRRPPVESGTARR
jgi:hypothetical protein